MQPKIFHLYMIPCCYLAHFFAMHMFGHNHKVKGESSVSLKGKVAQILTIGNNSSLRKKQNEQTLS